MEKYLFHSIMDSKYLGIVTILDYEIRLNTYLSELVLPSYFGGKKALVDLALKSGLDEYRFVSFDVDDNGKLILNTNSYAKVSEEIEKAANCFLQQRSDIVNNSILTDNQKRKILIENA
ncbi:MAG: type II toxin-antitoxin system RnlB family antitoxin [Bacteroides fragilis]|nr:type II toxin-antitoxin system RnlB family antitoxin [Bacteroides fragilis]